MIIKQTKRETIFQLIKENGSTTVPDMIGFTGFTRAIVTDHMRKLHESGRLNMVQVKSKDGYWRNFYTVLTCSVPTLVANPVDINIYLTKPEVPNPNGYREVEAMRNVIGKRYQGEPSQGQSA